MSENYPPDTVRIVLAVETTASSVSQAMQKNKISADKVTSVLKELIGTDMLMIDAVQGI